MKVQIVHLDEHDDRNSILDRIGWVQAPRLVLVWPAKGTPVREHLDLALIQRKAEARGCALGLVTHDPDIRQAAKVLSIPLFESPEVMPERIWRRRPRRSAAPERSASALRSRPDLAPPPRTASHSLSPPGRAIRIILFAVALLSLLTALIVALPTADVILDPVRQTQSMELRVPLAPGPMTSQGLPALWRATRVSGEERIPTTGEVASPAASAQGVVVFTNLGGEPVTVPAGTGLRAANAEGVRFETTQPIRLAGEPGSQASVAIRASPAGTSGNLAAGEVTLIEGPLGLTLSAENPEPTTGGTETERASVSPSDLRNAENRLLARLEAEARARLVSDLSPGEVLFPSSIRLAQTYRREFDHAAGDPADTLGFTADVQFEALVYATSDLVTLGLQALEGDQPGDVTVPGSLHVEAVDEAITTDADPTSLLVRARRETVPPLDRSTWARRLAGQTPEAARQWLASRMDLAHPASIRISPEFFPVLPWLPIRIEVLWTWEATS